MLISAPNSVWFSDPHDSHAIRAFLGSPDPFCDFLGGESEVVNSASIGWSFLLSIRNTLSFTPGKPGLHRGRRGRRSDRQRNLETQATFCVGDEQMIVIS